jgi:hypothetical protein
MTLQILRSRSTHAAKLERFLGKAEVERLSNAVKDWYGPPIAVGNVPGAVYARGGGDFVGPIEGGGFAGLMDIARARYRRFVREQGLSMGAGIASLSAAINAATTAGRTRRYAYIKGALTGVAGAASTLFYTGSHPPAGSIAAGAPGGAALDDSTTGAFPFTNPGGGTTQHLMSGVCESTIAGNTLLLYDRIFSCAKTMNSNATEAVTGVPTRYQSTTSSDADYAGGNFMMPECVTTLPATAHNQTVWQYTDQDGNTGASAPSIAGISSCAANRIDLASPNWFMPLATGDTGVKAITQMQHSNALASGTLAGTMGHPLAFFPSGPANTMLPLDFINSAFNLTRIFDDACMAFLLMPAASASSTTYTGELLTVSN